MASESANTFQSLNAMFKETYASDLKDLIPDQVKLLNMIKFLEKGKQPGNFYHQPVILGQEHGVTFAASDEDAFNLQPAANGAIKDAVIRGNPILMRSLLGYVAASRAAQGGAQSFKDATKYLVANMLRSMSKKLEAQLFYGQSGYASVASAAANVITITTAEWAPGIWAGAEGMPIEFRDAASVGSAPETSVSKGFAVVKSVDLAARTVTLEAAVPGLVSGDVIFHKGAFGNEFPGVHRIISKQTGLLFGINVGDYNLFRGNMYDAGAAALSFNKMNLAIVRGVEKGQDGKLTAFVNPKAWANMLNDLAALRMYDSSYSTAQLEQGSQKLRFFSQSGEIEIIPSTYVKEGYAYLLSTEDWKRVGSSDLTFKRPGQGDEYFRDLENAAAYELRLYSDQAPFTSSPAYNTMIFNIVNAT